MGPPSKIQWLKFLGFKESDFERCGFKNVDLTPVSVIKYVFHVKPMMSLYGEGGTHPTKGLKQALQEARKRRGDQYFIKLLVCG